MIAIIGPRNSGKSRAAEALFALTEQKIYLGTLPFSPQFEARIERHRHARRASNWIDAEYSPSVSPAEMLQGVLAADSHSDCRAILVEGVSALMARRIEFLSVHEGIAMKDLRGLVVRAILDAQTLVDDRSKLVLVTGDDRSRDGLGDGISVANAIQELMRSHSRYEELRLPGEIRVLTNGLTSGPELDALSDWQAGRMTSRMNARRR